MRPGADPHDDLGRGPRPLRHRQARPALRHGAAATSRRALRRHRGQGLRRARRSRRCGCPGGASISRSRLDAADRAGEGARRRRASRGSGVTAATGLDSPLDALPQRRRGRGDRVASTAREAGRPRARASPTSTRAACRCSARCASQLRLAAGERRAPPLRLGHRVPDVRGHRRGRQPCWRPTTPSRCRTPRTSTCSRPTRWRCARQAYDLVLNGWELGSGLGADPPRRHPVAGLPGAGHHRRGGRERASASCSAPSATGRRRTPASPSASTAWWRSSPARRTSARSSPSRRPSPAPT